MDTWGLTRQFLPPEIRALDPDMVIAGYAMPVLEADCCGDVERQGGRPNPFGLMLRALDELKRDEVYICTGGSPRYALWGELMSTRAMKLGAAGAVVDGYSRDTRGILALNFPTFSYGRYAQDQGPRGKVIDYRCPIEIDGARIEPGDILFGDLDGVCVIPRRAENEVFTAALEKSRGEKRVAKAIREGMSALEAFDKFGIM
jgi:regulator of RNase E activity RraA